MAQDVRDKGEFNFFIFGDYFESDQEQAAKDQQEGIQGQEKGSGSFEEADGAFIAGDRVIFGVKVFKGNEEQ